LIQEFISDGVDIRLPFAYNGGPTRAASRGELTMLKVTVENLGEIVILRCAGRIVRGHETALLCSALQQEGRNIILDLAQVDAIDAAGIGALVLLQAAGIYLKLINPTERVREILKITQLDSVFEFVEPQSIDLRPEFGKRPAAAEVFGEAVQLGDLGGCASQEA
jgi:anti-anti-sigma factor